MLIGLVLIIETFVEKMIQEWPLRRQFVPGCMQAGQGSGIVLLLSKDFIKLVLMAVVIAVPLCIWAMNEWLKDFSYRISIGPVVFLEAGLITVSIAMITIAWQSVKAARANPVQSLRNE